jgi:Cu/Ag efflux pump CusA
LIASYFLAMTLASTCASRFLKVKVHQDSKPPAFEHWFEPVRERYGRFLQWVLARRALVLTAAAVIFVGSLTLYPFIGTELFPAVDAGQLMIRVRAPSGTRVEVSEGIIKEVEDVWESQPDAGAARRRPHRARRGARHRGGQDIRLRGGGWPGEAICPAHQDVEVELKEYNDRVGSFLQ